MAAGLAAGIRGRTGMEFEKLYTAEDVVQITGLTLRTIRSYIKSGKLKGRRIGVQWRFTAADIEALFETPGSTGTAEAEKKAEELSETEKQAKRFLERAKAPRSSACVIVDMPGVTEQEARFLFGRLQSLAAVYQDGPKRLDLSYEYDADKEQARYVFDGAIDSACAMMNLCEVQ